MTHIFAAASGAVRCADAEALDVILRGAPDVVHERDEHGRTLLAIACRVATSDCAIPAVEGTPAQYAIVDQLLAGGSDVSAAEPNGWTSLHSAAMAGHVGLARRLLDAGASHDGHLLGTTGGSPLSLALFYAKSEFADLLGEPIVPENLRSNAAMGRSVERFVNGDSLTADAAFGADFYRPFEIFPPWERTFSRQELLDESLSWASRNGRLTAMVELVALGADVNSNAYRGTPLLWSVYADRVDAAAWLLDHGADADLRHDFGGTDHGRQAVAMHLAAQYGCLRCLRLLLDRGADAAIRDATWQGTPLDWAQHVGATESTALLLAHAR